MAKLKQGQLTLFLKGSDTETQPVEEERESEGSVDSQPPTKKAKHRESGFDQSWYCEFAWAVMEEDDVQSVTWTLSLQSLMQLLQE